MARPVRPQAERYTGPTNACNQDDATGCIRLNGLLLKVAAKMRVKKK